MKCKNIRGNIIQSLIGTGSAVLLFNIFKAQFQFAIRMPYLTLILLVSAFLLVAGLQANNCNLNRKGKWLFFGFILLFNLVTVALLVIVALIVHTGSSNAKFLELPIVVYVFIFLFLGIGLPVFMCFVGAKIFKSYNEKQPLRSYSE